MSRPVVWSHEQNAIFREAESPDGNVVVVARAGTGKTTSIEELVKRAPERDILVCAFNKSIAEEAKRRMPANVQVKTLHSLGCKFMFRGWDKARLDEDRGLRLATRASGPGAPQAFIKLVARLASLGKGACPERDPRELLDLAYDHDILPDEEWEELGWTVQRLVDCAVAAMSDALVADGTYDFDDMVYAPLVNGWVRPSFDLVVVDEAQDMNKAQLQLAKKVARPRGRVFIVGDDRQAIYGFRGADAGAIQRMERELRAKRFGLTITRRCPQAVVREAQLIVPDFTAAPDAPQGELLYIDEDGLHRTAEAGRCFVLSRTNAPLASVAMRFLREGTPCRIQGRDIGQALAALVNKLASKKKTSIVSFIETVGRWLENELAKAAALEERGKAALADRRRSYVSDQHDTLVALSDGLTTTGELVARLESLFSDSGKAAIVCSSVHRSKGLEMPDVFLLDWTFRGGSPEEDNIRYVALTRAKERLFLVEQRAPQRTDVVATGKDAACMLDSSLDAVAEKHHGADALAEAYPDIYFMGPSVTSVLQMRERHGIPSFEAAHREYGKPTSESFDPVGNDVLDDDDIPF